MANVPGFGVLILNGFTESLERFSVFGGGRAHLAGKAALPYLECVDSLGELS